MPGPFEQDKLRAQLEQILGKGQPNASFADQEYPQQLVSSVQPYQQEQAPTPLYAEPIEDNSASKPMSIEPIDDSDKLVIEPIRDPAGKISDEIKARRGNVSVPESSTYKSALESAKGNTKVLPNASEEEKKQQSFDAKIHNPWEDDAYNQLVGQINSTPYIKQMEEINDQSRSELEDFYSKQNSQPNLYGLLKLGDFLSGRNEAEDYAKNMMPMTPQQLAGMKLKLSQELYREAAKIPELKNQLMKTMVYGADTGQFRDLAMALNKAGFGGGQNSNRSTPEERFAYNVVKDRNLVAINDTMSKAREALQLAEDAETSPVAANNLPLAMVNLRNSGSNMRGSIWEAQQEKGSKAFFDKLEQLVETTSRGTMTKENLRDFKKNIIGLISTIQEVQKFKLDQFRNVGISIGVRPEVVESIMNNAGYTPASVRSEMKKSGKKASSSVPDSDRRSLRMKSIEDSL